MIQPQVYAVLVLDLLTHQQIEKAELSVGIHDQVFAILI